MVWQLIQNYKKKNLLQKKISHTNTKHQSEAGITYFNVVSPALTEGKSSTISMEGSNEKDQF